MKHPPMPGRRRLLAGLAGAAAGSLALPAAAQGTPASLPLREIPSSRERLPVMVCPRWIRTRIQPIGARDLVAHLVRALDDDVPAGVYEVGGADVTTYREMIDAYARARGLRRAGGRGRSALGLRG